MKNNEPVSPCGVFMEPVCPSHALCVPVWGFAGADLPDIPMSPGASKSAGEAANLDWSHFHGR